MNIQNTMVEGISRPASYRWLQLFIGIVCMAMIANLNTAGPSSSIRYRSNIWRAAIQVAFTIFVLTETWLVPIEGYLCRSVRSTSRRSDRWPARGIAWVVNAYADTLTLLYIAAAIGGIGAGAVYGTCVGNALKWFADRRGLAAGLTAAGFGAGSALTIIPIQAIIKTSGYETAFLYFGIAQGIIVMLAALGLTDPRSTTSPALAVKAAAKPRSPEILQTTRHYRPLEVIREPVFWVMYVMFVLVGAGGLMATAQLALIAKDYKIADTPVNIIGIVLPALTFALAIDRILNGITRPFFDGCPTISDVSERC
jgi:OFA family oxalate/formate antiporter-like MFS transporter